MASRAAEAKGQGAMRNRSFRLAKNWFMASQAAEAKDQGGMRNRPEFNIHNFEIGRVQNSQFWTRPEFKIPEFKLHNFELYRIPRSQFLILGKFKNPNVELHRVQHSHFWTL